jgi:hypothetical protein
MFLRNADKYNYFTSSKAEIFCSSYEFTRTGFNILSTKTLTEAMSLLMSRQKFLRPSSFHDINNRPLYSPTYCFHCFIYHYFITNFAVLPLF